MRALSLLIFVLILGIAGGCGAPPASPPHASKPPSPPAPPKSPSPPGTVDSTPPPATPMVPAGDPPLDPAARPAAVGMGKKGHYTENGLVTPFSVPISARFRAEERIILNNIKHAMDLYKAQDPQGKGPKTHAEFMQKIIQANQINLPQLPDGQDYQYDPAQGELMVVPKKAPAP